MRVGQKAHASGRFARRARVNELALDAHLEASHPRQ
jgi:hypothetical protein